MNIHSKAKIYIVFFAVVGLCPLFLSAKKKTEPATTTATTQSSTAKTAAGQSSQISAASTTSSDDVLASYPERFREINNLSLSRIKSENFNEAIKAFFDTSDGKADAFNFNRDRYSSYARLSLDQVDLLIDDIKIQISAYEQAAAKLSSVKLNYNQIMNVSSYEEYASDFASARNRILEDGLKLRKAGNDPYILSLNRFVLGVSENKQTGILGEMDAHWDFIVKQFQNILRTETNNECKLIYNFLTSDGILNQVTSTASIEKSLLKVKDSAQALKEIIAFYGKINLENGRTKATQYAEFDSSCTYLASLCDEGSSLIALISDIENSHNSVKNKPADNIADLRSGESSYSLMLFENGRKFSDFKNEATSKKRSTNLRSLQSIKNQNYKWDTITNAWNIVTSNIETFCEEKSKQYWIEGAQYYSDCGKDILKLDTKKYNEISGLITSSEKSYAQRCNTEISALQIQIQKDIELLQFGKNQLETVTNKNAWFKNQMDSIKTNSIELDSLASKCAKAAAEAKAKVVLSQSAKNEIEIYYNQALTAYQKNNFAGSFDNLTRTKMLYQQKLNDLKNDADIQEELYKRIEALRSNIIAKQESVYFAEINKLKSNARFSYYAGNFDDASAYISQIDSKREQWAKLIDADVTEDATLEQLRDFINTARTIKEGRDLSPYDAKAPEMTQNLSIANYYYEEGKKLSGEGKTEEAAVCFNKATDKVNQIKIYYPRNKNASILSLKIEQVMNKDTFDQTFATKVKVLSQTKFSDKSVIAQQNYNDLLDLYELNPDYPGLKNIVTNAEYDLGLRQRKVNNDNSKRAQEIAVSAQKLLNNAGRDELKLNEARSTAQRAIALDPSNNVALSVLDEISLRTGSRSAVVLSAADEELYNKAVADLQAGKIFDAREKLNKLLANPANVNSAKIQKLKRRIDS